jgi:hypothetical protein
MLISISIASSRCWRSTFSNRRAFSSAAEAGVLVQHLGDADHLALLVADRDAEDIARAVAGVPVYVLVEARVLIGVGDDLRLAAGEHRSGDADMGGEANLADGVALHHPREQFAGVGVVEEQRTAVGVERLGHHFHQARKQHVEREAVRNAVGDVGERGGAPQEFCDAVEKFGLARFVKAVQQAFDILLMQAVFEDLANGFEADLHARSGRRPGGLWMRPL